MPWNPSQYLKFADERLRPGLDLLGRVGDLPAGDVYDLGCGTGAHARAIAERWPDRAVIGIDASPEMLEKAAATTSSVRWMEGRVESWRPPAPAALVFSNAVLHWADGHAELFPRLAQAVAPGGVLAVQMPRSFSQPSHVLMRRTAQEGPWAARLAPLLRQDPVAGPETYYDLLAPLAVGGIDMWETEYVHVLRAPGDGESPILSWVRGTALRPLLEALPAEDRPQFIAAYDARLREAYPRRADGMTLFPFRRLFIVARR